VTGKSFVLTVSQCKRLIGKGVAALPEVIQAMRAGLVIVAKGSTNGYVLEELLGRKINKTAYVAGCTVPWGVERSFPAERMADVILKEGKPLEGVALREALSQLKPGDVFIKGANALNYRAGVAGILMGGGGDGGTIGAAIGRVVARQVHWIIPVGLEKEVPFDILEAGRTLTATGGDTETLMPAFGKVVTEIEAMRALFPVEVIPIGAGGIFGAEGSLRLYIYGEDEAVEKAARFVATLYSEQPFGPSSG